MDVGGRERLEHVLEKSEKIGGRCFRDTCRDVVFW